ncbi:sugar ABC transporter substrate-binding protein, partial [Rhodoglobus aureus]|uniref:ABC transporter substrate-binding protein n=1 Tax=Rhodoglobus aureus TaxID=191497 RepID=UPI0031DE4552
RKANPPRPTATQKTLPGVGPNQTTNPGPNQLAIPILGLAVAAGLASSLVACAPQDSGNSSTNLSFWQYYGDSDSPNGVALQAFIDNFEAENADVSVDIRFIPFGDFNRTLIQSAVSGDLPDVALINAFDTASMADAGVTLDLSDRVSEWGEQDAYFPTSWETAQVGDATYGIPHLADAYAVYYNTELLDAAGLTPPTTWDEMEATAAALAVDDRTGLALSGIEGAEGATGLVIRTLAEGGTLEKFDSPEGTIALDSFQTMVDSGALSPGFLTWIEDDVMNQFATGQSAMMINSASYISVLNNDYPDLDWDVALLPEGSESRSTFLSAENLSISLTSEHADEAWDLITFMQRPEELEVYLPARNKLAARNDVPDASGDPVRATFAEQLNSAWAPEGKLAAGSNEIFTFVQQSLQAKISGTSTADALAAAQASIDETLAK